MENFREDQHEFNTRGLCENCGFYKWQIDIIEAKNNHLTRPDKYDTLTKD